MLNLENKQNIIFNVTEKILRCRTTGKIFTRHVHAKATQFNIHVLHMFKTSP